MLRLRRSRQPSPIGEMLLVTDEAGALRALDFTDYEDRMHTLLRLHYGTYALDDLTPPPAVRDGLASYFAGDPAGIATLTLATGGTPFQRAVWSALREIPFGTTTYGALAQRLGRPTASRAVGAANGANPIAIVVPCHRVIGANGDLTGYGGGMARKRWLLEHEAHRIMKVHGVDGVQGAMR
jgi:methylated-DNA-[protein]-cysteine S-methyltransferase